MSLFATVQKCLQRMLKIKVRQMFYTETDRPPSWLRAELQHKTFDTNLEARWKIPSSSSWSGLRLLVRPQNDEHQAVLDIALGPLWLQLLYSGPLVPNIKPGLAEIFLSDFSLGRILSDDSRIGWQRWSDPDSCKEGDRTNYYLADLLFGKETHKTLETKEEVLALTMPDGVKIPMRMKSEYRRRSRPRGARSHYYLRDRSYGPSAEPYHLSRRSGPARTVYDALGEDFAEASRSLGVTPWEPEPWHCDSCRGTGMQMDWSRPCTAPHCREGIITPDALMEDAFSLIEAYIARKSISDLLYAESFIEYAIEAARALKDRMSVVLLHGSLIYVSLAGCGIGQARRVAAAGLCELYAMAEATRLTAGDQVFDGLERHFYQALRLAHGDGEVAPTEILLMFEQSPVGPRWVTQLQLSQRDLMVGAAAAQNLAHDLALEQAHGSSNLPSGEAP